MFKIKASMTQSGHWLSKQIDKQLNRFTGQVRIGAFGNQPIQNGTPNALTMVDLMAIHEFGSVKRNIPQRSFLRASLHLNQAKYGVFLRGQMKRMLLLKTSPSQIKNKLGMLAVSDLQAYIGTASFTPLHPKTIQRKKSSRPLIDTGRMRQSVSYQVD